MEKRQILLIEQLQIINVEAMREVQKLPLEHRKNCYNPDPLMSVQNLWMKI